MWSFDRGVLYLWLKDESYVPPVAFLTRPHCTTTRDLAQWPVGLVEGYTALIPKEGPLGPQHAAPNSAIHVVPAPGSDPPS